MRKIVAVFIATIVASVMCACGGKHAASIPIEHYTAPLWIASGDIVGIGGIRVLSNGRVIVGDFGEKELWMIDADGKNIRSVGHHGSGPIEFTGVRGVLPIPGDSTLIVDDSQRRLLVLDEKGSPVRTVLISPKIPQMAVGLNSVRTDVRGRLIMPSSFALLSAEKDVPLLRWDWRSDHLDTVARVAVIASHQVRTATTMSIYAVDFTPNDWFQPLSNGETAIIRAANYQVDVVDSSRKVRHGDTITYNRIAVADSERLDADAAFRDRVPSVKPPFDGHYAVASPEGELWVRRLSAFNSDSVEYDVIGTAGKRVRIIRLPKRSWVLAITPERVYISRINDDDFEVLQAFARK